MRALQAAFAYLAVASVISAALAVTRRNIVHSVLWVLALFLHVAGIYLLLGAEFLAAAQLIIYAGAILVFYLVVLMLLDLGLEEAGPRFSAHWPVAAAAALGFGVMIAFVLRTSNLQQALGPKAAAWPPSVAALGARLYGDFAIPVEVASLVLLAAIVGAVVLAKKGGQG